MTELEQEITELEADIKQLRAEIETTRKKKKMYQDMNSKLTKALKICRDKDKLEVFIDIKRFNDGSPWFDVDELLALRKVIHISLQNILQTDSTPNEIKEKIIKERRNKRENNKGDRKW